MWRIWRCSRAPAAGPALTLQVLEGERHDAPRSSSSHQTLDVGGGQGEDEALLTTQVSACVEGDEDGLVHAGGPTGHHAAHGVGQLLSHQERLQQTQVSSSSAFVK